MPGRSSLRWIVDVLRGGDLACEKARGLARDRLLLNSPLSKFLPHPPPPVPHYPPTCQPQAVPDHSHRWGSRHMRFKCQFLNNEFHQPRSWLVLYNLAGHLNIGELLSITYIREIVQL